MFEVLPLESASRPVVEATGVCKAYLRVPVLFPLSFSLNAGDGLCLLGPNGSGKTTLLRLLAGVARPSEGEVTIRGHRLFGDREAARQHIGFAGHDSYLYEDMTGLENLRLAGALGTQRPTDIELATALEIVGLQGASRERVRTYSAGMKRRLGLARMILTQPRVLLLDEPHASLDSDGQMLVDRLISDALSSGRTIVLASHDRDRALSLCRQVIVLDSGRVTFQGESAAWDGKTPLWVMGQQGEG